MTNSVQETIQIIDRIKAKKQRLRKKLKEYKDVIDIEARNAFLAKKVMASVLKCASGYNYYGVRHTLINNDMIEENCPKYNEIET